MEQLSVFASPAAFDAAECLQIKQAPAKKRAPRYSQDRLARRLAKLSFEAVDCLEQIISDPSAKAADRLSAAKLAFDLSARQGAKPDDEPGTLRVIFEGVPHEYAE